MSTIMSLLTEVEALERAAELEGSAHVAARLRDCATRPLRELGPINSQEPTTQVDLSAGSETALGDKVWQIAQLATGLRIRLPEALPLQEAVAALQDLAVGLATDESSARAREEALRTAYSDLAPRVQLIHNGPYLVTNVGNLHNWLGERLPVRPQMALCRCGNSAIKPLCDGSHSRTDFDDAKDPKRVADRRDRFVGQQVTVIDNRGTCQHSGFCTARLPTVFHEGGDPFVTPSGGRMDEIIRAVRDCPSGALSFAVDGAEARAQVAHGYTREMAIEVSKDGPYRITGAIPLLDPNGRRTKQNEGASAEHFALCRCGHSQNKPFCSGMHYYVGFKDPALTANASPTIFEWAGGLPALTRMTRLFYEKYVPEDQLLSPLFADMSPDHPQRVAMWLAEVFGGPPSYSEAFGGYPRMVSQHLGRGLSEEKRARWVQLLLRSAQDAGLPNDPEFRAAFGSYIEWGSRLAVENSQVGARPPQHMPMPHWDWKTAAGPPGGRISATAPESDEPVPRIVLPASGEEVRFDAHIKPMFRSLDRKSMAFLFDLWSYADVSKYSEAILERLKAGTMPCDGPWPHAQVDAFQRWVDSRKKP